MRRLLAVLLSCLSLATAGTAAAADPSGPDVASYQHPYGQSIAWGAVAAGGSSFAFVKATEGSSYVNPYYAADAAQAHAGGLVVGAYHFARPALPVSGAADQARYFVAHAGGVAALTAPGELPPVLDLEVTGGLSPSQLLAWAQTWLGTVEQLTGRTPMIYTYPNFWPQAMANTTALGRYPLWIASYSGQPVVLPGWQTWTFWQYTDSARLPGMPSATDVSYFNGSLDELRAFADGGPPPAAHNPVGFLDTVSLGDSGLQARGWAEDPDEPTQALVIHVYVDGRAVTAVWADQPRPDVAAVLPDGGPDHGYTFDLPAPTEPGTHSVCTYAINVGAGTVNPVLGCKSVTVAAPDPAPLTAGMPAGDDPVGAYDTLTAGPGLLEARGWSIDPDTTAPVNLHVYVDGTFMARVAAGTPRPDVARVYPAAGDAHGFDVRLASSAGSHRVCVYGINTGAGSANPLLGCRTVTVPAADAPGAGRLPAGDNPVGVFDALTAAPGVLEARGWSIDPDTTAPVNMHLYVDGVFTTRTGAGTARPDVGRVYPAAGDDHGFDALLVEAPGEHTVCVYAINSGAGTTNPRLGCRSVTVPPS